MFNPNVKYNVTGRYMDGQTLVGYHLVGEDGSQIQENKERVIFLISRGIIDNMRIQTVNIKEEDREPGKPDKELIIRGKGVNLNTLPVFDVAKRQYRGDDKSQEAASSKYQVNAMGQYKIIKRIMYKNTCMGYEVQDYSGKITRKQKDAVKELALQKLISNAVAQKYIKPDCTGSEIILRGVGCDLRKLPVLIVKEDGKIVDPTKAINDTDLTIRVAYMKHSGIMYNIDKTQRISFKAGDFIICEANGQLSIKDRLSIEKCYTFDKQLEKAVCDDYLNMCADYIVEIFGSKPIQLNDKVVKAWSIMRPRKAV